MTVTDINLTDTVEVTVLSALPTGGSFSGSIPEALTAGDNALLKAMLEVSVTGGSATADISSLSADPDDGSNFEWTFTSGANGDAAFDFLAAGETLELTYTVQGKDSSEASSGDPATDTSTVTVTITGTNDVPTITVVDVTGRIQETAQLSQSAAMLSDTGSITFADVDP